MSTGGDSMAWVPIESNPEVMNEMLVNVGVPAQWKIYDVLGLDDELLCLLPKTVLGLVLLYPLKGKSIELFAQVERR